VYSVGHSHFRSGHGSAKPAMPPTPHGCNNVDFFFPFRLCFCKALTGKVKELPPLPLHPSRMIDAMQRTRYPRRSFVRPHQTAFPRDPRRQLSSQGRTSSKGIFVFLVVAFPGKPPPNSLQRCSMQPHEWSFIDVAFLFPTDRFVGW